jgi:hypothetical protein
MTLNGVSTDNSSRDARECLEGNKDDGVDRSSGEASNDRGAKGWQIVTSVRGTPCPYTA